MGRCCSDRLKNLLFCFNNTCIGNLNWEWKHFCYKMYFIHRPSFFSLSVIIFVNWRLVDQSLRSIWLDFQEVGRWFVLSLFSSSSTLRWKTQNNHWSRFGVKYVSGVSSVLWDSGKHYKKMPTCQPMLVVKQKFCSSSGFEVAPLWLFNVYLGDAQNLKLHLWLPA